MASIQQRKTSYAVIYWYTDKAGKRKQKWDTVETKAEAKKRKAYVEYYQSEHGDVLVPVREQLEEYHVRTRGTCSNPKANITLREFLQVFVDLYGTTNWSLATYKHKCATIRNYINPYIGDWKLCEITTGKLSAFYHELLSMPEASARNSRNGNRCVQPTAIRKVHDVIRCALNQAIRWEYLDEGARNPALLATLPRQQKNKRKVWSIETFREAVQVADDQLLVICMHLAFSCSMRVGEISGLTWDNVVIDEESIKRNDARVIIDKQLERVTVAALQALNSNGVFQVFPPQHADCSTRLVLKTPKSESSNRTVWIPRTLALMLVRYREEQQKMKTFLGNDYHDYNLVIARDNGKPVEGQVILERFKRLCKENGYEDVVFHSLRHLSTGYKLMVTGGDVKSVQGDTGHAEAEMVVDVYSEIIDENRRNNAQRLEETFYSSGGVAKEEEGFTQSDLALLKLLKGLSPELKKQLLAGMD